MMNFSFKGFMNKSKFLKKLLAILAIFSISATSVEARVSKSPSTKKTRVTKVRAVRPAKIRKVKVTKTRTAKVRAPKVTRARTARVRAPKVTKRRTAKVRAPKVSKAQQKQAAALQQAQLLQQQKHQAAIRQAEENKREQTVALQQRQQEAARRIEETQRQQAAARLLLQQQEETARRIEETRQQTVRQQLQAFEQVNFTKTPLQRITTVFNPEHYESCDIGFTGRARSAQYAFNLPTAPILHPYHPTDNAINYLTPAFTLNLKLPGYLPDFVPEALHRNLADINPNNIDVFVEVQDRPWNLAGAPLLLRPQSWLDPEAPFQDAAAYSKSFTVRAGLFSRAPGGPIIQGQPSDGLIEESGISTHNSGPGTQVVSSSATLPIQGLNLDTTTVFYSLTKYQNRAAVVKHIVLNPQDERVFEDVLGRSNTLSALRNNLRGRGRFTRNLEDELNF